MDLMLKDRVAVVTGAGRGIGQATALLFAREGAKVVVCDIDPDPCHETVTRINTSGGISIPCDGDVLEPDFPEKLIQTTVDAFGPSIDIIVNNAGYGGGDFLDDITDEFWKIMSNLHAMAPFKILRAASPFMKGMAKKEMSRGLTPACRKIINISSVAGTDGLAASAAYASAKAAVEGLTKSLAKELGRFNICVNAISFGLIDTRLVQPTEQGTGERVGNKVIGFSQKFIAQHIRMTPLGRIGSKEEAAGSILMMASPLSDFITGQVIKVSGGL